MKKPKDWGWRRCWKNCSLMTLLILLPLVLEAQSSDYHINYPPEYEPNKSRFFVHNEIIINAPDSVIWKILIDAEAWPNWYTGAKDVKITRPANQSLAENGVFTWNTMNLDFESTIREFKPYERLSWESNRKQIQGYHAWLIIPMGQTCRVITDESQNGWLTFFEKLFQPKKLKRLHDLWLSELKKKAEAKQ
jgi:Polyketide cyclase / dehydrase and lipid transport